MAIKKYKNIFDKPIHVNNKKIELDEVFEEKDTRELKNLVLAKYLEVV